MADDGRDEVPGPASMLAPEGTRVALDASVRRIDDGRILIGGSPTRLLRLTEAGARLVDRLSTGEAVGSGVGARRLARRLLDRGMAHPRVAPSGAQAEDVTVVIPVYDRVPGLERTLAAISRADDQPGSVVVVDDGSPGSGPAEVERRAAAAGARFVGRLRNGGPGAARNSGLELVDSPLVVFVDADVEPAPDWMARLLPHLDDPVVAAVAPRVLPVDPMVPVDRSASAGPVAAADSVDSVESPGPGPTDSVVGSPAASPGALDGVSRVGLPIGTDSVPIRRRGAVATETGRRTWSMTAPLGRFERSRSPLDLGSEAARVAPRTRVAYVPTTTLVARVDAVREVGGFDERLAFGEDVDLVWRLVESGRTVRYEPAATVTHPVRPDLRTWLRQRFDYGCSAAPLSARHPDELAPLSISAWSAAAWTLAATGFPVAGTGIAAAATLQLPRRLTGLAHPWQESLRLAGGGTWGAWRPLSTAITRTWWPAALAASVVSRRARRAVVAAAVVPPLVDWLAGDRDLDPARYLALRLLDDLAYGAGLWAGCLRHRTARPLVPDLTSWPGRSPAIDPT